jgi:3-isopropylmalate/(R)-2-methylmalate dehydratase small subunit
MAKITGRARVFGKNIDTDSLTPSQATQLPMEEMKKYCLATISPDFYKTVKEGDIIVAGTNFGCGSSREQATDVLKALGIKIIVSDSIARIYFRNCIALGLYPIMSPGVRDIFAEGDSIEIDTEKLLIKNLTNGKSTTFKPLSGLQMETIEAGGIMQLLKKMTDSK